MENNRIEWVDMLKGLSILWLIVYHFYVWDWLPSPVPAFFLSGLFFSIGRNFKSFLTKKSMAILVPFAFFYILGLIPVLILNFEGFWNYVGDGINLFTLIPIEGDNVNPL